MKQLSNKIIQIVEIVLNIILLPFFGVKIFHEVAVLPGYTEEGQFITQRFDYYYSIIDNLKPDSLYLIHLSGIVIIVSILISIVSLFLQNKKLRMASHIVFCCSIAIFLIVLFIASTYFRCY